MKNRPHVRLDARFHPRIQIFRMEAAVNWTLVDCLPELPQRPVNFLLPRTPRVFLARLVEFQEVAVAIARPLLPS